MNKKAVKKPSFGEKMKAVKEQKKADLADATQLKQIVLDKALELILKNPQI